MQGFALPFTKRLSLCAALIACLQIILQLPLLAATPIPSPPRAPDQTHSPLSQSTGSTWSTTNLNLDLSSTKHVVRASDLTNFAPATILVNNQRVPITSASYLTPAELMAFQQVLTGGRQALAIGSGGNAVSGSLIVKSAAIQSFASITVPSRVALAAIGYDAKNPLNVNGSADLFGSMFALQPKPNIVSVLNINDLTVERGAQLSGFLPTAMQVPSAFSSGGMNINVATTLTNHGTITTPGVLNLNAGTNIVNSSARNGEPALINGQQINILAGTGNITNAGIIRATDSINIGALNSSTDLMLNNSGGRIEALGTATTRGVINFRTDGPDIEAANVTIKGGVLDARGGVNVFGKNMQIDAQRIIGAVSTTGSVAHVSVSSGNLTLGKQLLSGDPTYYDNAGDITIADLTSVGGDLAIVASGNIITTADTSIQTTAADNSIFLSAGSNFSIGSGTNSTSFPANDAGDVTNTLTFDGTSNAGMNINAAGHALNLTTTGNGTITLVATGTVSLGAGTVSSGNGNIAMIGGNGVSAGAASISTSAGNVTIASATTGGLMGVTVANGTVSALPTVGTTTSGNIALPSITSTTGSINITAGAGTVSQPGGTLSAAAVSIASTGTVNNLSVAAPSITTTQTGTGGINITDSIALTGNGVSTAGDGGFTLVDSAPGGIATTNSITSTGAISLSNSATSASPLTIGAGGLSGTSVSISGNGGAVTINGPVSGDTVAIESSGNGSNGSISGSGQVSGTTSVSLGATSNHVDTISLSNVSTPNLYFAAAGITFNVTDTVAATIQKCGVGVQTFTLTDAAGITLGTTVSNGPQNFNLNSDNIFIPQSTILQAGTINFNGATIDGSLGSGTAMVVSNKGSVQSISGNVNIASAAGQDLVFKSDTVASTSIEGNWNALVQGDAVNITATDHVARHPSLVFDLGNQSFSVGSQGFLPGGAINISAPTVTINAGVAVDFSVDYSAVTVTTSTLNGNPSQFLLHTYPTPASVSSHPNLNSTLTINNTAYSSITIVNDTGPLDLSQVSNLNLSGTGLSMAILSGGDIINSGGGLTIDLSGGGGNGGSLLMVAGYAISPSTGGATVQPPASNGTTYSLGAVTTGGSINLGNVDINTSGAIGGGLVSVLAAGGTNSDGSVTLGNITTNGGIGRAGAISINGNNIATGAISATGQQGDQISLGGVGINPGGVINGLPTNTSFPGAGPAATGTIATAAINAPTSNVHFIGTGDITASGTINAQSLQISTASGNVNSLVTQTGSLNVTAGGNVTISNLNVLGTSINPGLYINANGAVSFTNSGNLSASNIFGASGVTVNVTGANSSFTLCGTFAGTREVNTTNAPISIIADQLSLGAGIIDAGTGTVTLTPYTTSNAINIAGGSGGYQLASSDLAKVTAGTLVVGCSGCTGGININGAISVPYSLNFLQGIGGSFTNNSSMNLAGNDLLVNVGAAAALGTISSTHNLTVTGSSVTASSSLINTGTVQINSDNITVASSTTLRGTSVTLQGLTTNGTFGGSTNMVLNNSGTITSTSGDLTVASAPGQDLAITGAGGGQFAAPVGKTIGIIATDNPSGNHPSLLLGPGNQSFLAGDGSSSSFVNFTANGGTNSSITVNSGVSYDFPSDNSTLNITTGTFYGDPSQFTVHTGGHPNANSIFNLNLSAGPGTIANSSGGIDLTQLTNLNFGGPNLAIIAATNISNSGNALTINLASAGGIGGTLVMLAGFNFTPSTSGVEGSNTTTFTLAAPTVGGFINLPNVNIATSGSTGGGSVLLAAAAGTNNNGSINIGRITATGGSGSGGTVTVSGSGVTVGDIDTTASAPGNSGAVSLASAASVSLPAGGPVQVQNGAVCGGSLTVGAASGPLAIGAINAGQAAVQLQGLSISGTSQITAARLDLTSDVTGSISLTNLAVPVLSFDNFEHDVTITDTVAANIVLVPLNGSTFTFTDQPGITISCTVSSGPQFVFNTDNFTLSSGKLLQGQTISINGMTAGGDFGHGTNMVVNNLGAIEALTGNVTIASAAGQDLLIESNPVQTAVQPYGYYADTQNSSISITATDSASVHPTLELGHGNLTFGVGLSNQPGGTINFTAPTVKIDSGVTIDIPEDASQVNISTGFLNGNPAQFLLHTVPGPGDAAVDFHPNPNSTLTVNSSTYASLTIANSSGPIDLSQVTSLNLSNTGQSLAIISAGNIINSGGALTIDLSASEGMGGNLLMVAGFDFSPTTGGTTLGPGAATNGITYSLSGVSAGGSISLGNVSINTSGSSGAGNVTVIAQAGTTNDGSISLGSITANGGTGRSGPITIFGNGISLGAVSATSSTSSAPIQIQSTSSIGVSGPKILNGVPLGNNTAFSFPFGASNSTGAVTLSGINAPEAALQLGGGNISSSGTINGYNITIGTSAGDVSSLVTQANSSLSITAAGNVTVHNLTAIGTIGSPALFINASGSVLFTNEGSVVASNVFGGSGVGITINGANNSFSLSGNGSGTREVNTTNAPISITADQLNLGSGVLDAGTGTVTLAPYSGSNTINLAGGSGGYQFTDFSKVTAGTLAFGCNTCNGGIAINGAISAPYSLSFIQGTGNSAGITNNSTLNLNGNDLSASVPGSIDLGTTSGVHNLILSSAALNVGSSLINTGTVDISADSITVSGGTSLQGTTVSITGLTVNGTLANNANMLISNSGTIQSTTGNIDIRSAQGQDVTVTGNGNGQFICPTGQTINIIATDNPTGNHPSMVLGPGNQSFVGGTGAGPSFINIAANGNISSSLMVTAGVTYDFPSDNDLINVTTANFFGNPAQFAVHTVGHANPNSVLNINLTYGPGTIANSTGPIDLSQVSNLHFPGRNLAILSATNIINTGNTLTIDLSNASGSGGNLLLIAGYNFDFSTGGVTVGPVADVYTLTNITAGGSINLGNVNIDASGSNGGGSVSAIANQGSINAGSINLGTIKTNGGSGTAGSVSITGNGVTVGAIDTTSNNLANSGWVTIISTASATLSSPGNVQVANGVLVGGSLQAGSPSGTISVAATNAINAGQSSVILDGGSLTGAGLITAASVQFSAAAGAVNSLNTSAQSISATASGNIDITNTGNLTSFSASSSGAQVNLTNNGDVTLGADVTGTTGVNVTLNVANKDLILSGHKISSTNSAIKLTADQITVGAGSIDAGNGAVTLVPLTGSSKIFVGGAGAGLQLSSADLNAITAGTLVIGSNQTNGGIFVNAPTDVSPSSYAVQFLQGTTGSFANTSTLNVGVNSLTVTVGGTVDTGGIKTHATVVDITGSSINVSGNIGSTGDHTSITATSGDIAGSGTVSASILSLHAIGGNVGSGALTPLSISSDPSAAGTVSLSAQATGNVWVNDGLGGDVIDLVTLTNNVSVSASGAIHTTIDYAGLNSLSLTAGSIVLSNDIGATSLTLASSTITQSAGVITSGNVLVQTSGTATLSNANLIGGLSGTGNGTINLNTASAVLQLGTFGSGQNLNLNSTSSITIPTDNTALGSLSLTAATVSVTAKVTASTISLSANAVTIASGAVLTGTQSVLININNGGIFTNNGTIASAAALGGTPSIRVQNSTGGFAVTGTGQFSQTNASPGLTQISATGTLIVQDGSTLAVNNGVGNSHPASLAIYAPSIILSGITTPASASISTNGGLISIGQAASGLQSVSFGLTTVSAGTLHLDSSAGVTVNASGTNQSVQIADGLTVSSTGAVTLNTCNLSLTGTANIAAPGVNMNCPNCAGTIANSQGDLKITSPLVFHGLNLALLAAGSITVPAGTIDLSNTNASINQGNGGSFIAMAGFNFTPATSTQPTATNKLYTIGAPSASGGSLTLTNVNINTSSTVAGARAGNVVLLATSPNTLKGSVTVGSINLSCASCSAGNVQIYGANGITVGGAINTTGASNGAVTIAAETPVTSGYLGLIDGNLVGGGTITPTNSGRNGNISLRGISAGTANIALTVTGLGAIVQAAGTPIAGGLLTLSYGAANINLSALAVSQFTATGSGSLTAQATSTLNLSNTTVGGALSLVDTQGINVMGNLAAPLGITLTASQTISVASTTLNTTKGTLTLSAQNGISLSSAHLSSAGTMSLLANKGSFSDSGSSLYQTSGLILISGSGASGISFGSSSSMSGSSITLTASGATGALMTSASDSFTATTGSLRASATTTASLSASTFNAVNGAVSVDGSTGITLASTSASGKLGVTLNAHAGSLTDSGSSAIQATNGAVTLLAAGSTGLTLGAATNVSGMSLSLVSTGTHGMMQFGTGSGALATLSATAGALVLQSSNAVTISGTKLQTTALNAALAITAGSGITINSGTPGSSLVSSGALALNGVLGAFLDNGGNTYTAHGALTVSGASNVTVDSNMTAPTISLTGAGGLHGTMTVSGSALSGSSSVNLNATGSISVSSSTLSSTVGSVMIRAGNGVTTGGSHITGPIGITISAGAGAFVDAANTYSAANGAITISGTGLTLAPAASLTSRSITLFTQGTSGNLLIGGNASATQLNATNGLISVTSSAGLTITDTTLASTSSLSLNATGSMNLSGSTVGSSQSTVAVRAGTGITASTDQFTGPLGLTISAGTGSFVDSANTYSSASGAISISGTGLTIAAAANISARSISLTTLGANGTMSIGGSSATTQLSATSGTVAMASSAGLTITDTTATSTSSMSLSAIGSATVAGSSVTSSQSTVMLKAGTGLTASGDQIKGPLGVTIAAGTGAFVDGASTYSATSGAITISGTGMTLAAGASLSARNIGLSTVGTNGLLQIGGSSATTQLSATSGTISVGSSAGLTMNNTTATSTASLSFTAAGAINVGTSTLSSSSALGTITVNGKGASLSASSLTGPAGLTISAGTGAFVDSDSTYSATGGLITVSGNGLTLAAGANLNAKAITLSTAGTNGTVSIGGSGAVTQLNATSGALSITSSQGTGVDNATLNASSTLNITATGSMTVTGSTLSTSQSTITLKAGTGITTGSSQLTGPNGITISAGTGAFADSGNTYSAANGAITTTSTGATLAAGANLTAKSITLTSVGASGSVSIGGAGLLAKLNALSGIIQITSAGGATVDNATLTTSATFNLTATGAIGVTDGTIASSQSTVTIKAGTGVTATTSQITGPGGLTITAGTGAFTDAASTYSAANGGLTISGTGLTLGAGASATGKTITLTSSGAGGIISIGGSAAVATLTATGGALSATSSQDFSITNAQLSAGSLTATAPSTGTLATTDIAAAGNINISSSGAISVAQGSVLTTNGGGLKLVSSTGIALGQSNQFIANGGQVQLFTKGAVSQIAGATGNKFVSRAVGTLASETGGTIELGAGTNQSGFTGATVSVPPSDLGTNINYVFPDPTNQGIVEAHFVQSGGAIDLNTSNSPANATTLNLTGGAIIFNDVSLTATIKLDGASFTVNAYKPIAYTCEVVGESTIDSPISGGGGGGAQRPIADVFVDGPHGSHVLAATGSDGTGDTLAISMHSGRMFIHPRKKLIISAHGATIAARKGALLAATVDNAGVLRVQTFSGPGDVKIAIGATVLCLAPGEEAVISTHSLSDRERLHADGIGRRNYRSVKISETCYATICDFSIPTTLSADSIMQPLLHPATAVTAHLREQLLKTAAAIDTVTKSRGAYQSSPQAKRSQLRPVSFEQ